MINFGILYDTIRSDFTYLGVHRAFSYTVGISLAKYHAWQLVSGGISESTDSKLTEVVEVNTNAALCLQDAAGHSSRFKVSICRLQYRVADESRK